MYLRATNSLQSTKHSGTINHGLLLEGFWATSRSDSCYSYSTRCNSSRSPTTATVVNLGRNTGCLRKIETHLPMMASVISVDVSYFTRFMVLAPRI